MANPNWIKGMPAQNPRGRPPQDPQFTQLLKLGSLKSLQLMIEVVQNPEAALDTRVKAADSIMDRCYGKAAAPIQLSGPDGGAIQVEHDISKLEMARRVLFALNQGVEETRIVEAERPALLDFNELDTLFDTQQLQVIDLQAIST